MGSSGGAGGGGGGGAVSSVNGRAGAVTGLQEAIEPGTYVDYSEGTLAARPAANTVPNKTIYNATDTDGGTLYRSNGTTWAQVAAGVSAGGGDALYDPVSQIHNAMPACLRKARAGAARAQSGLGHFKVGLVGDSTTSGIGAVAGVSDWPTRLRALLGTKGYPLTGTGFQKCSGFSLTETDPQWTIGAGWATFEVSYNVLSTTIGATLTFTSTSPGTKVDIYFVDGAGFGAFTYVIDGGAPTTVTPSGSFGPNKVTVTGLANTTHTVVITKTTTDPTLIWGAEVYGASGVRTANFGIGGATAAHFSDTINFYCVGLDSVFWDADLIIMMLEVNDANFGTSPATYEANVQTLITQYKAAGADVMLVTGMPQSSAPSIAQYAAFRSRLLSLAESNDCVLLDVADRWTSVAVSDPLGFYDPDGIHGTPLGYADIARAVLGLIGL